MAESLRDDSHLGYTEMDSPVVSVHGKDPRVLEDGSSAA